MAVSPAQKPINSGFGLRTEPDEIMAGVDLSGKTAVVTGGYSGLGLETVRALAGAGAHVVVPARNRDKAEAALADMAGLAGTVAIAAMDLADLASVRRFAEDAVAAAPATPTRLPTS